MSTIHCAIDWRSTLADNSLQQMLSCSDYWLPDSVAVEQVSDKPDVKMAKASLVNRPGSEFDNVLMSECGQYWIVANAHLDNRAELAQQLGIKDNRQLCDAEVILKAYMCWRENTASHLVGDFVFILWDNLKQQLYCARDHFGVKSLFYSLQGGRVFLSNEHKALLISSSNISRNLSTKWLVDVFMPTAGNEFLSPFSAIHSLPAAHYMIITEQGESCERYWTLKTKSLPKLTDEEYLTKLAELFEQAVTRRLVSQFPMAAELSEGLDSNGVVGYASRLLDGKNLYTMSFDGTALNDENTKIWSGVYQELFDAITLWPNVIPLWSDATPTLLKAGAHSETFGGPSAISSWYDARCLLAQSQGCRTVLSGWGGDHCVSGYGDEYVHELFLDSQYVALYRFLQQRKQRGRGGRPFKAMIRLIVQHKFPKIYHRIFYYRGGQVRKLSYLANHSVLSTDRVKKSADYIKPYVEVMDSLTVQSRDYRELVDIGVQRRMTMTEISARHFRCEFRYPMLDKDLVEFAYSLPSHLKCKNGVERYMFREVLKGHTTERIRIRRKSDVLTSLDVDKLRENVSEQLKKVLVDWRPELNAIFDKVALEEITQGYPHLAQRHLLVINSLIEQLRKGSIYIN